MWRDISKREMGEQEENLISNKVLASYLQIGAIQKTIAML